MFIQGAIMRQDIWKCNMKPKDVEKICKTNTVWKYVLKAWCEYNELFPMTYEEVREQYIWNNTYIRRDGQMIFYNMWYRQGIEQIKDIIVDDKFMSQEEICKTYNININWLDQQALISSIPVHWKSILEKKVREHEPCEHKYHVLCKTPKPTKKGYEGLISQPCIYMNSYNRWNAIITDFVTPGEYLKCFGLVAQITISTKLRDFQYRLLHKKIPTNKELHKWKIKNSPDCGNCYCMDSIEHTMFDCPVVQELWKEFENFVLKRKLCSMSELNIGKKEVLLNTVHKSPKNVVNLLCLIPKQLIYRCKCNKDKISFALLLNEIKTVEQIELYCTKENNRVEYHMKKWKIMKMNT